MARNSASSTRYFSAANQARESAGAAGKDSLAAEAAATDAFVIAAEKYRVEEAEFRAIEQEWHDAEAEGDAAEAEKDEGWVPDWLQEKANTVGIYATEILTNTDLLVGAFETAAGIFLVEAGAGGILAGGVVCLGGVTCVVGAPAVAISVAGIGTGAVMVGDGLGRFDDGLGMALRNAKDRSNASQKVVTGPAATPKNLPAFPGAKRAKSKTSVQGGGGLRARWKDAKGNIYEHDRQHDTVEKYDKNGKHLGEYDYNTGEQTKPKDPTRKVEK
ncbi:colicin E3/pyocin S6 family cytotoxin [Streptomyces sp. 12297]